MKHLLNSPTPVLGTIEHSLSELEVSIAEGESLSLALNIRDSVMSSVEEFGMSEQIKAFVGSDYDGLVEGRSFASLSKEEALEGFFGSIKEGAAAIWKWLEGMFNKLKKFLKFSNKKIIDKAKENKSRMDKLKKEGKEINTDLSFKLPDTKLIVSIGNMVVDIGKLKPGATTSVFDRIAGVDGKVDDDFPLIASLEISDRAYTTVMLKSNKDYDTLDKLNNNLDLVITGNSLLLSLIESAESLAKDVKAFKGAIIKEDADLKKYNVASATSVSKYAAALKAHTVQMTKLSVVFKNCNDLMQNAFDNLVRTAKGPEKK